MEPPPYVTLGPASRKWASVSPASLKTCKAAKQMSASPRALTVTCLQRASVGDGVGSSSEQSALGQPHLPGDLHACRLLRPQGGVREPSVLIWEVFIRCCRLSLSALCCSLPRYPQKPPDGPWVLGVQQRPIPPFTKARVYISHESKADLEGTGLLCRT